MILLALSFRNVDFLNVHPVNNYRDLGYLRKWDLWLLVFMPAWILCPVHGNESIRNGFKKVILSLAVVTFIIGATLLATVGVFGPKGIERYKWPVTGLMSITDFAASYFFQNIATTVFLLIFPDLSLVTVVSFVNLLAKGAAEYFGFKNNQSKLIHLLITAGLFALTVFSSRVIFLDVYFFNPENSRTLYSALYFSGLGRHPLAKEGPIMSPLKYIRLFFFFYYRFYAYPGVGILSRSKIGLWQ